MIIDKKALHKVITEIIEIVNKNKLDNREMQLVLKELNIFCDLESKERSMKVYKEAEAELKKRLDL